MRKKDFDSKQLVSRIGDRGTARQYQHKERIYAQGELADAMFFITSGYVKLTAEISGKNIVLAILGQDSFFGEDCLLDHDRRTTTATALQNATLTNVSKKTLNNIIRQEPEFSSLFVLGLIARIGHIETDFADHLTNSSEMRLARLLLELRDSGENGTTGTVHLRVDQATLAQMVGTTRSRVSYFMNRFRKARLIDYGGTNLQVHPALNAFVRQA